MKNILLVPICHVDQIKCELSLNNNNNYDLISLLLMYILHNLLSSPLLLKIEILFGFVPHSYCILGLMAQKPPVENVKSATSQQVKTIVPFFKCVQYCCCRMNNLKLGYAILEKSSTMTNTMMQSEQLYSAML